MNLDADDSSQRTRTFMDDNERNEGTTFLFLLCNVDSKLHISNSFISTHEFTNLRKSLEITQLREFILVFVVITTFIHTSPISLRSHVIVREIQLCSSCLRS